MRNRRERGEGQFGCLVGVVLLLLAGLIAYRMIPVKVKAAELRDEIVDEAKSGGRNSAQQIRGSILAKAQQLGLPLTDENLLINKEPTNIVIDATYTVPVNFPGYVYQWKFHHHVENPLF